MTFEFYFLGTISTTSDSPMVSKSKLSLLTYFIALSFVSFF